MKKVTVQIIHTIEMPGLATQEKNEMMVRKLAEGCSVVLYSQLTELEIGLANSGIVFPTELISTEGRIIK